MSFQFDIKITGSDDFVTKIQQAIETGSASVVGPMVEEMEEIRAASMEIVPVDSGDLRDSAFVETQETPNGHQVAIGYGGNAVTYALLQHETPPEVFRHDPGKSWKYLERPALEAAQTMGPRLSGRIARRFESAAAGQTEPGEGTFE
jgi:hypothetical protein